MYDIAIIGGGPGGYVAAICGAQKGLKVLLIEKDNLGGTCLNRGCIPTKSFVYDSKLLSAAKGSAVLKGTEALAIDPAKMLKRKQQVVKTMVGGLQALIKSNGIDVVNGFGQLSAPGKVLVRQNDGADVEYTARDIILANGSMPAVPPFIDVDGQFVQTTDEILDCEEIPEKLVVIGGGVIGIEMATIFLNLGVDVAIVELLPDILLTEDKEIRLTMRRLLKKRGAKLFLKAKAKDLTFKGNTGELTFEDDSGTLQTLSCDRVLVATGRAPVLDGIDTQHLNLEMDGGFVKVDKQLKTNLPHVYAIGDLVGGMMLAHKASAEAEAAIDTILGGNKELKAELIPRCIWGLAEIGAVGLTEEEAKATGRKIKTGKFYFMGSGAAQAMGHPDGFVKIIGDTDNGEILGAHIMGEHATDLIGDVVTTMGMESAVEDLAHAIKPHPTLSETIMEAALDWSGVAIHKPRRK
jgi:dihydrolipoamide dehydrogenase